MRALFPLGAEKMKDEVWFLRVLFSFDFWNLKQHDRVLTATLPSLEFERVIIKWALQAKFDKRTVKYFCITFLKAVVEHSFKSLAFVRP